ncbi:MAG: hypothetical protein K9H25_09890 [Rhodospirillum sp.]|nr:hypothetical protein [Rhodospirillum sp.]MCF8490415.1 hypothetical protein [Rhodospirillum sp.]MCF8500312.1 hypothetical protein [Rhodospirillum sp.]
MADPPLPPLPREILYEIKRNGAYMRVCAICADTGIEAVMVGPASIGLFSLKQNAARKLAYVIEKRRQEMRR